MTIRFALQIPNFSYGTGVSELYPTVIAQAREAEAAGFDSVFVMDHFYQLPMIGTPDQPMLEAYTALGGLAAATQKVQLGTMVTGNTYRNPTLLAKAITTLDVISHGRAIGSATRQNPCQGLSPSDCAASSARRPWLAKASRASRYT